jgi:integrase
MATGIDIRHSRACRARTGGRCNCEPSYQAHVWSAREQKRIRKTFPQLATAKAWRQEAQVALRRGTMRAPSPLTLRAVAEDWIEGIRSGEIRNRSGDRYKPSAVRSYDDVLRLRVLDELGERRFSSIRRNDLQDFADKLLAQGMKPITIQCTVMPLRAMYRRAVSRGEIEINPTTGLELPAVRSRRDRIASPTEAAALLEALPQADRAMWASALYAGLRRGELMALRWEDIDLDSGVIRVERGWDMVEGPIPPKTALSRRSVPIASVLRAHIAQHRLRCEWNDGLAFGKTAGQPFYPEGVGRGARAAWKAAKLEPITMHECRHTFASLMIAAGVNAKALSTYMGHANISITLDRYGHLMPGNETEAAGLLDRYLVASTGT